MDGVGRVGPSWTGFHRRDRPSNPASPAPAYARRNWPNLSRIVAISPSVPPLIGGCAVCREKVIHNLRTYTEFGRFWAKSPIVPGLIGGESSMVGGAFRGDAGGILWLSPRAADDLVDNWNPHDRNPVVACGINLSWRRLRRPIEKAGSSTARRRIAADPPLSSNSGASPRAGTGRRSLIPLPSRKAALVAYRWRRFSLSQGRCAKAAVVRNGSGLGKVKEGAQAWVGGLANPAAPTTSLPHRRGVGPGAKKEPPPGTGIHPAAAA